MSMMYRSLMGSLEVTKMADDKKHPLRVTKDTAEALKAIAQERDITLTEAAEQTIAAGLLAQSMGTVKAPSAESVIDEGTMQLLREWADANGKNLTEAASRLIPVGITRLAALAKYATKKKDED